MVFNRKRKDNRSASFILDDGPKRSRVQAQRKFAQGSNVNSPVLTPVTEVEMQEKVIPEPIELVPMKRPNTEDFLTFLCFRGTPALPPSLSFFNNATMTDGPPPISESPTSSKNGVILPANISKAQGEKPFIAFGVRKRADPIVVSRHMDKKRRHALALQALRRKYQEQKMAKIRAITISKLSEKVQTNKTVVRTTRSLSKEDTLSKKHVGPKTKITVVATKHVKVTTRRTSTQIKPNATTIKQKMGLRSMRSRAVSRDVAKENLMKKNLRERTDESDDEESDKKSDDDDFTSDVSESDDGKKETVKKLSPHSSMRVTRSNIMATKRNKRLLIQKSLKSSPTSPRLRSQLRRKMLQSKADLKSTISAKRRILTRPLKVTSSKAIANKVQSKSLKRNAQKGQGQSDNEGTSKKTGLKSESKQLITRENKKATKKTLDDKPKNKKEMNKGNEDNQKKDAEKRKSNDNVGSNIATQTNFKKPANRNKDDSKTEDVLRNDVNDNKAEVEKSLKKQDVKETSSPKELGIKTNSSKDMILLKTETKTESENQSSNKRKEENEMTKNILIEEIPKKNVPCIENNRIRIDDNIVIEEINSFKSQTSSPKSMTIVDAGKSKKIGEKRTLLMKSESDAKVMEKIIELDSKISQRPSRKTKEAAAIYMEILGRKLVHDEEADDLSNDSFPELPNVRKMEQRENELKAIMRKSSKTKPKKVKDENAEIDKKSPSKIAKNKTARETPERRRTRQMSTQESASDTTFSADIRTPPPKAPRKTRNLSPKFYKSFSDSETMSEPETKPAKKRKSENANDSDATKKIATKKPKKQQQKPEESFSESDEEPLAKLTQKVSEKSKSETESNVAVKQKRECAKRPQNYLPIFSSSDEEEKFFRGFQSASVAQTPKKKAAKPEIVSEALSTKDIGRRFGKGKVNMSNEQIEKWLNDSAIANMSLIKAENDEMLKFGERIPTETSLDNNLRAVNMEQLKNSLLKVDEKDAIKPDTIPSSLNTTPDKSTTSSQKPLSNEKKTIFRKAEKLCKNSNAFSVCNESSVYAFEADNEDSVSTPFRRPSRRPSSTATSRSEDESARMDIENKSKFRQPGNVACKTKQEVSLLLADESNHSGSITVQVNLESAGDNEHPSQNETEHMFYIPIQPGQKTAGNIQGVAIKMGTEGSNHSKLIMSAKLVRQSSASSIPDKISTPMFPPSSPIPFKRVETKSKASCSMSETSDDFKYKVPSSPSASSSSSAKLVNKKKLNEDFYKPINSVEFPNHLAKAQIVDAPVFRPTEKEFVDPLEYIGKIREIAEKFGVCKIIPPGNFKPECKVLDEMRFTAYNQYVHKMMHRWGPNFRELVAIRKYLSTQSISLKHPPWIGGIEVDLPKLYQTVQLLGGLKEVIEKKKWPRVAELMKIPKSAQDRVTKLDDIYCKYLLPYDTLTIDERENLFQSVELHWAHRESKMLEKAKNGVIIEETEEDNDDESDSEDESDIECIVKGRSMALSAFYRIARNTMAMWFKDGDPSAEEVEAEFWKHVMEKEHHICVHSGSIDSGNLGYGFAVSKNSPFARHAWNLKVLTNNSGSILRSMGPVMGLTVPTLHVGMLYAGCCWYRDPHSLPWIEYLHTGANKIWYGIPDSMSDKFHETMLNLVPHYCFNKSLWLPTDTVMVPPSMLVENGLSLTRTVQEPGQFVVVFPKAFTSNICAGYVVSESVFWAPPEWLNCADKVFLELRNSCEPSMFSYERLILSMAEDPRTDIQVLRRIIPPIQRMIEREMKEREKVKSLGIKKTERLPLLDAKRRKKMQDTDTEYICEECRWNLYCTMICDSPDNGFYCLEHAIEKINDKQLEVENCNLMYTYDDNELNGFVAKINNTIEAKLVKKAGSKFCGMATLLNR